jgi:amino acid transporter
MTDNSKGQDTDLERTIGWWGVAAAAIGLVVASTTFAGDFNGYAIAGPAYVVSLFLGFLINLFVMFAYAELTTMFPKAGQIYEFTKRGFSSSNRRTALLLATGIGTTYWLIFGLVFASEVSAGAYAMVGTIGIGSVTAWIIGMNVLAIGINFVGLKLTVIVETILVILMVGIRVLMGLGAASGLSQLGPADLSVFADFTPYGLAGVFAASTLGVWAFIGLEFATPLVEEVKQPSKNIPKGMTIGAFLVLLMALTMGLGIISAYNPVTHQGVYTGNAPQIEIAGVLFGPSGTALAGIASFAATLGSLLISYAAIPRIVYAMAREGLWPKQFAWLHPRFETPWVAIAATGIIFIIPIAFSNQVVALINAATAVWLLVYVWVFGLAIKLRYTHAHIDRPFSVNQGVYFVGLALIFLVLWKAFEGAYELIGLALVVFIVGFTYAGAWLRFTADEQRDGAISSGD